MALRRTFAIFRGNLLFALNVNEFSVINFVQIADDSVRIGPLFVHVLTVNLYIQRGVPGLEKAASPLKDLQLKAFHIDFDQIWVGQIRFGKIVIQCCNLNFVMARIGSPGNCRGHAGASQGCAPCRPRVPNHGSGAALCPDTPIPDCNVLNAIKFEILTQSGKVSRVRLVADNVLGVTRKK